MPMTASSSRTDDREPAGRYVRVLRTFADCFLRSTTLRPSNPRGSASHIDEYKTRRAAGEIVDEARSEDSAREQALHLELAQVRRKERPLERAALGGWAATGSARTSRIAPSTTN